MPGAVIGGSVRPILSVAYQGPGDVVSGARVWYGLRAYTEASIGSNAVRLRRDSDNSESDFVTVTGGGLDLDAISSFKGAANLFVTKLYDQTGNGDDVVQSTAANQPAFTLNGIGTKPIVTFNGSTTQLQTTLGLSATFTDTSTTNSAVVRRTGNTTSEQVVMTLENAYGLAFASSVNTGRCYITIGLNAAAADNTWHSLQAAFNTTNTALNIDGTSTTGNAGSGSAVNPHILVGLNFGQYLNGDLVELGAWQTLFSGSQLSSMSANQHSYWGF